MEVISIKKGETKDTSRAESSTYIIRGCGTEPLTLKGDKLLQQLVKTGLNLSRTSTTEKLCSAGIIRRIMLTILPTSLFNPNSDFNSSY